MSSNVASSSTGGPVIPSAVDEVKGINSAEGLNSFLKGRLNDVDYKYIDTLTSQELDGSTFLDLTREDLLSIRIPLGPVKKIVKLIDDIQGEPPNKRRRVENTNLTKFRDAVAASAGITAEQQFLRLPDGVTFLGEKDEPSTLLIRKCYRHLLDIVLDNNNISNWLITGNPGIGKTYFSYYLLYNLIKRNQTVIYDSHSTENHVIAFDQGRVFYLYEVQDADEIRAYKGDGNNWYIVDAKKPDKVSAKTILVCSPKKDHYVEFEKFPYSTTRYMPVWSYEEIRACRAAIHPNLTENFVKTLFDRWGGIPRFVLEQANDPSHQIKLEEAIHEVQFSILNYVGTIGASNTSHKLIHITTNPLIEDVINEQEPNIDGGNDVGLVEEDPPYSQKLFKFASEHVAKEVIKQLESIRKGKLRRKLYSSLSEGRSNSVLGRYFEEIAHQLLLGGGTFNIRSLEPDGDGSNTKTFIKQGLNTFSEISSITDGIYYRPDNPNYPSIDSLIAPNELYQMTTTLDHPIKMVGLKKSYEKLAKHGEISYYFVVPAQLYNNYRKQKFVPVPTRNNENQSVQSAQNMPSWIRNRVKQYTLRIDLGPETSTASTETAGGSSAEESSLSSSPTFGRPLAKASTSTDRPKRGRGRPPKSQKRLGNP